MGLFNAQVRRDHSCRRNRIFKGKPFGKRAWLLQGTAGKTNHEAEVRSGDPGGWVQTRQECVFKSYRKPLTCSNQGYEMTTFAV